MIHKGDELGQNPTAPPDEHDKKVYTPAVTRPGISKETLAAAGVRTVTASEANTLVGYPAPGVLIPYLTRNTKAVIVGGRPFCRLRLSEPHGSAKYLSPRGGGCQLYEPPGLATLLKPGCVICVVEGEFKALALVEAGFPCVAIGGISSACPRNQAREPELLPSLSSLIEEVRPSKIAFVGGQRHRTDRRFLPRIGQDCQSHTHSMRASAYTTRRPW